MNPIVRYFRIRLSPVAKSLFSMLPDCIGRLVLPNRYRLMPAVMPPIEPMPPAPRRVLIGALNTAGQAYQWARSLSAIPGTTAVSISRNENAFQHPVDITIPRVVGLLSGDWQREHVRIRGFSATDILIESGSPIFGPAFRFSLVREVAALQKYGIRVAVVCHGSDVRDFAAHIARNPLSPYRKPEFASKILAIDHRTAYVRRAIRSAGVPVLGSTYGVLIDLPEAVWCPVVVDPDAWVSDRAPFSGGTIPHIVHAPSRSSVKGSEVIDFVVHRLVEEGLVRYTRLEGVENETVKSVFRNADIMIDSLGIGGYGVAACDAMAAGCVVLAYVLPSYRQKLYEDHGWNLPILQADPDTLDSVLRGILADPAPALELAARGPEYVRELHDGRVSAAAILKALDHPSALGLRG